MPDEADPRQIAGPMDLWTQWYETALKMWRSPAESDDARQRDGAAPGDAATPRDVDSESDADARSAAKSAGDPFRFYEQWLEAVEHTWRWTQPRPMDPAHPAALYRRWIESMRDVYQNAMRSGSDPGGLTRQWVEIMEDLRARMAAGDASATNPLAIFREWYNATSEASSKIAADFIGSEAFVGSMSRSLDAYTSFHKTFSRASEQYYRTLQLPTRSDITRVAELVVSVESKVDRIEEALEDFESRSSGVDAAEAGRGVGERLDRVEEKLDRLLRVVEQQQDHRGEDATTPAAIGERTEDA